MESAAPVNILLVDDQPENLVALEAILGGLEANLVKSTSGEEALRHLLQQDFAVILLDVQMPQMDGFELATLIRNRPRSQDTPIIFLTAFSSSEQFMFKGYALGAVDYLIKPIAPNVLLSKVSVFIELFKKSEALRQNNLVLQQQTQTLQRQAAQMETINAELRMSEERFRLLCTCSPLGVFVTNPAGEFVYANPRFQAICGDPAEGSDSQGWLSCVYPDDLELARSTWSTYLQDGQEYAQELRLQIDGDSLRWVAIRAARVVSDQQTFLGYVGTIEDVTARKQAEATNAQIIREQAARQEAETANRMKDDFIAVLSHELRTPLNSILGWSHLLQSRSLTPEKVDYAIQTIERNALNQKQLIEDILDVSQIVRGKLQLCCQPLDLVGVAQAALETVQPAAEAKAIALTHNLESHPRLEVIGDALRLQQVIWNLLTNAIKFTDRQGCVSLALSMVKEPPDPLPHQNSPTSPPAAAYVQLQVTDSGIGIDPDFLPHMFDRFRQADSSTTRAQGGLGLGLAIVHYLVEQHQGFVWAESAGTSQGSTFTVLLPLATTSLPSTQPSNSLDVARSLKESLAGKSILLIEDDGDTRDLLAFLLESQGAAVTAVASGTEGLTQLVTLRPALLLCDISMPDMDGYTLIEQVRTTLPGPQANIPAIAITAHARLADQAEAIARGFQHHLPKPIEPDRLLLTIHRALEPSAATPGV